MPAETPLTGQPTGAATQAATTPNSPYPEVHHNQDTAPVAPTPTVQHDQTMPVKQEVPAVGLPVLPADTGKALRQPPFLAEGLIIQISLAEMHCSSEALTMRQGRMVPAWDPRLEAMGMSRAEFEQCAKSFMEVRRQGEPTSEGICMAVLATIFCCICSICVYCCVVDSQKMAALQNHCSSMNAQQAHRGFTWRMLNDTGVELKAVPAVAPMYMHARN